MDRLKKLQRNSKEKKIYANCEKVLKKQQNLQNHVETQFFLPFLDKQEKETRTAKVKKVRKEAEDLTMSLFKYE